MRKRQSRWRSWTALLAAYALALQTLFIALSYGAHAGPGASDLHVLCLSADRAADGPLTPADPAANHLDCCVLGSHPLGKLLVPPAVQALPSAKAEVAGPLVVAAGTVPLSRHRSPLTARGPPRA